ncbi:MAG TPA: TetR/AcrR family transcriptional regulator [Sphingomonas sp.]|nr:TetR/AcrR family transcriptional regulator [Sphingomonas sp.]
MNDERGGLRERLVRVAMSMLADGSGELSLRSVARAAGVSAMAPYRHFPDKAALLGAVADAGFELLRAALAAADATASGREALVAQGLAYLAFAQAHPALFRLMFSGRSDCVEPREPGQSAYAVLAGRVERIVPDAAAAATATTAAWAIVHGLAMLALDGRVAPAPDEARSVLALFTSGLG